MQEWIKKKKKTDEKGRERKEKFKIFNHHFISQKKYEKRIAGMNDIRKF